MLEILFKIFLNIIKKVEINSSADFLKIGCWIFFFLFIAIILHKFFKNIIFFTFLMFLFYSLFVNNRYFNEKFKYYYKGVSKFFIKSIEKSKKN